MTVSIGPCWFHKNLRSVGLSLKLVLAHGLWVKMDLVLVDGIWVRVEFFSVNCRENMDYGIGWIFCCS